MSDTIKSHHTAASVPPEYYHLDILQPQATRPRDHEDSYYTWKRGADNSMPTRPPPPPTVDRLYRSCCCGSIGGLIAWIIFAILVVAGITALIVKSTLPHSNNVTSSSTTAIPASLTPSTVTATVTQALSSSSQETTTMTSTLTTSVASTPPSTVTVTSTLSSSSSQEVSTFTVQGISVSTATNGPLTLMSNPRTATLLTKTEGGSVVHASIQVYVNTMRPPPTYSGYPETMYNRNDIYSALLGVADSNNIPTNMLGPERISALAKKDPDASNMVAAYDHVTEYCENPPLARTNTYYSLVCGKAHTTRMIPEASAPQVTHLYARQTLHETLTATQPAFTDEEEMHRQIAGRSSEDVSPSHSILPTSGFDLASAKRVEKKVTTLVTVVI